MNNKQRKKANRKRLFKRINKGSISEIKVLFNYGVCYGVHVIEHEKVKRKNQKYYKKYNKGLKIFYNLSENFFKIFNMK